MTFVSKVHSQGLIILGRYLPSGTEPTTFAMLAKRSANRATRSGRYEYVKA